MSPAVPQVEPAGVGAADRHEEHAPASFARRSLAFLLDGAVAWLLSTVGPVGGVLAVAYLVLRDGLWGGASVGKRVFALRVVDRRGDSGIGLAGSFKRNVMFVVPLLNVAISVAVFEGVVLYFDDEGLRLGDRMAGTRVVQRDARGRPCRIESLREVGPAR